MRKSVVVLLIAAFVVVWFGVIFFGVKMFSALRGEILSDPAKVAVPKGTCPTSLAVFNFRPHGDSDAKYYAIGFARSLADRTYCAPKHVTQQMSANEISGAIRREKKDSTALISDELAVKLGKKMGVSYVVTGDLTLLGGNVNIALCVNTSMPGTKQTFTASGNLADLPDMQSKLAPQVIMAMKITPDSAAAAELKRCNFTNSGILKLYGQSFLSKYKECEALRWEAVKMDPIGSFAFARLLDYYNNVPVSCAELRNNKRLASVLANPPAAFSSNSQIAIMSGLAYSIACEYEQAEAILQQVVKDDSEMIRAHTALAYVARLRENGDLAVAESARAVRAWPNNAYLHASLSKAYDTAADNARQGHYYGDMSSAVEREWNDNCRKSLEEAYLSVKLDPNCEEGWFSIINTSREQGRSNERDKAYANLLRLDPTNIAVYSTYAFCFSTQWGGSDEDQEKIFKQAEKAFPKGSYKPLLVRALSLSSNVVSDKRVAGPYSNDVLALADEIYDKTGGNCEDALLIRSGAYMLTRRRADFLKVNEEGFKKWGGLKWQFRLGMGNAFAYEDRHDRVYLERARQLFTDYSREVPFDPRGYIQVGWCLSHLGRRAEAKAQFLKALKIDPANESAKEKMKYVE